MTDDLADALSSAFDQVSGAEADAGQGSETAGSQPEAREEPGAGEAERARDEAGRFAKAERERKDASAPASKADGKDKPGKDGAKDQSRNTLTLKEKPDAAKEQERTASQQQGVAKAGTSKDAAGNQGHETQTGYADNGQQTADGRAAPVVVPAPTHWGGDGKIDWHRLPAGVKEAIAKDYESVATLRDLQPAVQHFAPMLMQRFGNVGNGLGSVLTTWQQFQTNPLDTIRGLMQQSGIQPHQLAGGNADSQLGQGQGTGQSETPQYLTRQDMAALLERREQETQQRFFAQQIDSEVASFGTAVATDGSPKYPYFNDVRPVMAGLFTSGAAKTLDDAYSQAVYANPAVRQKLMAQQQAQADAKRREAAVNARGASASIAGAPGGNRNGMPQKETIAQTLGRVVDDAYSGRRI